MIRHHRCVRRIAREISDAAEWVMDAYRDGRVVEEPMITDRIIGAIEDRTRPHSVRARYGAPKAGAEFYDSDGFDAQSRAGMFGPSGMVVWRARSLRTSSGIGAEEKRHGADLMGVLNIDLPNYRVKKGFLAQAKRAEPERKFSESEWKRLQRQCQTMLDRTPVSFVWVYSREAGVRVVPAVSVLELNSRDIFDLYHRSVSRFFEDHIMCFIGDHRLNSTDIQTLDALREMSIERILELSIETVWR